MSKKFTKKEVKKAVNKLGYKLLGYERNEKHQLFVNVIDNNGFSGRVQFKDLRRRKKLALFHQSNPFTIKNINLWLDKNNKNFLLISKEYKNAATHKLEWYCFKCSEIFFMNWAMVKDNCGCSVCAGKQIVYSVSLGYNYSELIKEWSNKNKLSPFDFTSRSNKKVWWKCSSSGCGHEWEAVIASRSRGRGCPICLSSKGEDKIREFFLDNNIQFEEQVGFDKLRNKNPLKFDFYLLDYSMAVEYNGKQHYEPIEYFGGEEVFQKQQIKDQIKRNFCKTYKIKLLEIPYTEFNSIEAILKEVLFYN